MDIIKKNKIFCLQFIILLLLISAIFFSACMGKEMNDADSEDYDISMLDLGNFEGLDAQTELLILKSLAKRTPYHKVSDYKIIGFYGIYNGVAAFIFDNSCICCDRTTDSFSILIIEDIFFVFHGGGYSIFTWKDGNIYWLKEAYDLGLLTRYDIEEINNQHRIENVLLYEKLGTEERLEIIN